MKKKIIAICLVAAMGIAAAIGGTLAYFTDYEEATNTFTVGDVDIQLLESKYHREGNGNAGIDSSSMAGTNDAGTRIYTDDQIKADAAKYQDYLAKEAVDLVPGRKIAKCPYVVNTGSNAAYVRIRVLVPSLVNGDFVATDDGGIFENQWTATAIKNGAIAKTNSQVLDWSLDVTPVINRNVDVDGVKYDEYVFTYTEALEPGEMTYWNCWNYFAVKADADNEDITKAIELGALTDDGEINILVQADAIQSEGLGGYAQAFRAFNTQEGGSFVGDAAEEPAYNKNDKFDTEF